MAAASEAPSTRRFRRRTVRIAVRFAVHAEEREATATTLGAGGLFVQTDRPLPRGTRLVVRFSLPGGSEAFELTARVVFAQEPGASGSAGMGLEFTDAHAVARVAHALEALPEPQA
jgi:uncharacterized protein (TIGR02266 family)